jgi:hypothetical protein
LKNAPAYYNAGVVALNAKIVGSAPEPCSPAPGAAIMPNDKTPFKLTSSKSGSGLLPPAKKHQYQRTSSGTHILNGTMSVGKTSFGKTPFGKMPVGKTPFGKTPFGTYSNVW